MISCNIFFSFHESLTPSLWFLSLVILLLPLCFHLSYIFSKYCSRNVTFPMEGSSLDSVIHISSALFLPIIASSSRNVRINHLHLCKLFLNISIFQSYVCLSLHFSFDRRLLLLGRSFLHFYSLLFLFFLYQLSIIFGHIFFYPDFLRGWPGLQLSLWYHPAFVCSWMSLLKGVSCPFRTIPTFFELRYFCLFQYLSLLNYFQSA